MSFDFEISQADRIKQPIYFVGMDNSSLMQTGLPTCRYTRADFPVAR